MAREKVDRGQIADKLLSKDKSDPEADMMAERLAVFESNDVPDPEVLHAILNRKTKYDKDLRH